ncbi:MAG: tetratricopeptide repeat protein [Chloroflexi bacterium]|nr:tetratricopeptide repeat protein [Chloroflexota bacterium]
MAATSDQRSGVGRKRRDLLRWSVLLAVVGALAASPHFAPRRRDGTDEDFRRALELHREGRYDQAAELFASVAESRPGDPLPHVMRGSAYANNGQFREAVESFSQALELAPDDAVVYLYRGDAYLRMGLRDEARQDFEAATALTNGDERVAAAAGAKLRSLATQGGRKGGG